MTNKFNIDEYVFFTENDMMDSKAINITMGQIVQIEKISEHGYSQIIYTVNCLYAVTHSKQKWGNQKLKRMNEDCIERDFKVIECRTNKAQRKFYTKSEEQLDKEFEEILKNKV